MQTHPAPSPAPGPGWFADPGNPAQTRWWDGYRWTDHVAPGNALNSDMRWLLPVGRPVSAIVAGYLGLFCLLPNPFTCVPAVVCGVVALRTINRNPQLTGEGRAWFGIVMGGLNIVLWAYVFAFAA